MDMEKNFRMMELNMKENMFTEKRKGKEKLCFLMDQDMWVNLPKIKSQDLAIIFEQMARNI